MAQPCSNRYRRQRRHSKFGGPRSAHLGALILIAAGLSPLLGGSPASAETATAASASCVPAGSTGLTAAMVQTTNLSGATVDASGCDIGIYVPPGTSGITITGVTVTGANDHGIFVQDASDITISNSTIENNGVAPTPGINENKAVELVGTSGSTVSGNTVTGNVADGGIGIADDGPQLDPAAPKPSASALFASSDDTVENNQISNNYKGCGIVLASYVPGAGVRTITAASNTITGTPGQFGPHGPVIGQIVVATDAPATTVSGITISGNTVSGSFLAGITLHANAPRDSISGTDIENNTLTANNWGDANGAPQTDAIALEVNPIPPPVTPVLSGTTISGNTITGQYVGVWQSWQVSGTVVSANSFSGERLLYTQPAPGGGYWEAAGDGGVFSFGDAGFYGSMGGQHLAAPVVGISQTRDQGGYILVASDGEVFTFGDATSYGSLRGKTLAAPVVGASITPVVSGPPGTPGTNGLGYWLVAADGGVFSFGDAGFHGSMGGQHLDAPVVGIAPTPDGLGYWLVAADGGVFSFGDAHFYGSMGGQHLDAPVVGIAPTPDGKGYWLYAKDGGVFSFGDAHFYGSMGGHRLNAPVVAGTATGSNGVSA